MHPELREDHADGTQSICGITWPQGSAAQDLRFWDFLCPAPHLKLRITRIASTALLWRSVYDNNTGNHSTKDLTRIADDTTASYNTLLES